jgi:hypothetical protein
MKIGIEVEGRLRGVPTLFCDADYFIEYPDEVKSALELHGLRHCYISDTKNDLAYPYVGSKLAGFLVTMDVTKVFDLTLPKNVTLMVRNPSFSDLQRLRPDDQIKYEENRQVFVFPVGSAIKTQPHEFANDQEI